MASSTFHLPFGAVRSRLSHKFDRYATALYNLYTGLIEATVTWRVDTTTKMITVLFTLHGVVPTELPANMSAMFYTASDIDTTYYQSQVRYVNPNLKPIFGSYGIKVDSTTDKCATTIGVCVPTVTHPLLQTLLDCFPGCTVGYDTEEAIRIDLTALDGFCADTQTFRVPKRPVVRKFGELVDNIVRWQTRRTQSGENLSMRVDPTKQNEPFVIDFQV